MKFSTSLITLLVALANPALVKSYSSGEEEYACLKKVLDNGCNIIEMGYEEIPKNQCSQYYNDYCHFIHTKGIGSIEECSSLDSLSFDAVEDYLNYILKIGSTGCDNYKPVEVISGRCGVVFGKCGSEECCSEYGYCGRSEKHCGAGCQSEFGVCNHQGNKENIPVSTVPDRCGPSYGRCPGENECCSKYGYCGTSDDHCKVDCQSNYGLCLDNNSSTTPVTTTKTKSKVTRTTSKKVPVSTVNGKCGASYGACPENECCSKYGYCGTDNEYCGAGCQSGFGICGTTKPKASTTKKSTPTGKTTGKCGPGYGSCAKNYCCSKYGYCGNSNEYCGAGCQSEFGICKSSS